MRRGLALLLLLAGCANQEAGPCRLHQVADLPATLDGNRLQVVGKVDGADTRMLVDTGAERTMLTTATVAALRLPRSQRSTTRLNGIGGAVSNADVFAVLDLGHATISRRLAVADVPGLGGLVGADVLSDYDLELDLPARHVRLWQAHGCGVGDLPWTGPRVAVPITRTAGDLLRVPVTVDGKPVAALLDTGASSTVLKADAARRLGVTGTALAADPSVVAHGVDGGAIAMHMHRFATLALGADQLAGPRIGVADFQLPGAEMLLGMDYLRTRRLWIAYRSGQIFVQGP